MLKLKPITTKVAKGVHLLDAVHAAKAGDPNGCHADGTKRVVLKEEEATCKCCKNWYWSQVVILTERGKQTLRECGYGERGRKL